MEQDKWFGERGFQFRGMVYIENGQLTVFGLEGWFIQGKVHLGQDRWFCSEGFQFKGMFIQGKVDMRQDRRFGR